MKYNPMSPSNWQQIDTVLLDMDGTLLDLHFDNYFWQTYVPQCYAKLQGISEAEALTELNKSFIGLSGTLDWYCIDFWSNLTGLPILELKKEVAHKIAIRPQTLNFLTELRRLNKRTVIVTNAHRGSIDLKMARTGLDKYVDRIISSHDYQAPKESEKFWQALQQDEPFNNERTLFVDDSQSVLASAAKYGVKWLVSINNPDSQIPSKPSQEFHGIDEFKQILPSSAVEISTDSPILKVNFT